MNSYIIPKEHCINCIYALQYIQTTVMAHSIYIVPISCFATTRYKIRGALISFTPTQRIVAVTLTSPLWLPLACVFPVALSPMIQWLMWAKRQQDHRVLSRKIIDTLLDLTTKNMDAATTQSTIAQIQQRI
jgi:hypothetical protein